MMKPQIRVLLVEDSEEDGLLIEHELRRSGYQPIAQRVWSGAQMTAALREATWDLIICDYSLPGFDGIGALSILKSTELDIPFILVSGTIGEELATAAMKAGANDYLLKGNLSRLGSTVERELQDAKGRAARRAAEAALRENAERLRQMAEAVDQAFWLIDAKGKEVLYASPSCTKVLGYRFEPSNCEIRPWKSIHPDDRSWLIEAALTRLGQRRSDETYRIVMDDGSVRWIRERTFPMLGPSGDTWRIVGTAEDITERKELEERLRQVQKMEALGQLAGGVAHDFNNILCVIQGYASVLKAGQDFDAEGQEAVNEIMLASERANTLTRQLLTISRNQVFQLRDLDLNHAVDTMANMLRRTLGRNVDLKVQRGIDVPPVRADSGMIDQVLLNLGVNARDAMPQGGTLAISTEFIKINGEEPARHPDERPGEFVCLTVRDTGCGIAPHIVTRVFDPFFTTKPRGKGTGLGLAIVYGVVKQHEGWIDLESTVGKGTTFRIYLPRANSSNCSKQNTLRQDYPGKNSVLVS